jgi:predicted ATP-dependent protease
MFKQDTILAAATKAANRAKQGNGPLRPKPKLPTYEAMRHLCQEHEAEKHIDVFLEEQKQREDERERGLQNFVAILQPLKPRPNANPQTDLAERSIISVAVRGAGTHSKSTSSLKQRGSLVAVEREVSNPTCGKQRY